jgi:hypothetical protein
MVLVPNVGGKDMGYYKVYGKEYYQEFSDFFEEIVEAKTPREALYKFIRGIGGKTQPRDVQWVSGKPMKVGPGWVTPEPTFWTDCGHIFEVRRIVEVTPARVTCPTCKGAGTIYGYVELDLVADEIGQ